MPDLPSDFNRRSTPWVLQKAASAVSGWASSVFLFVLRAKGPCRVGIGHSQSFIRMAETYISLSRLPPICTTTLLACPTASGSAGKPDVRHSAKRPSVSVRGTLECRRSPLASLSHAMRFSPSRPNFEAVSKLAQAGDGKANSPGSPVPSGPQQPAPGQRLPVSLGPLGNRKRDYPGLLGIGFVPCSVVFLDDAIKAGNSR